MGLSPKKGFSGHKLLNSGVRESNENDCDSQHHRSVKMQTPKKQMGKHFMSPTISAASKVAMPRKKILGERNGVPKFSDSHSQKSHYFGPRSDVSGQVSPMMNSSFSLSSESDDDEKRGSAVYDPASSYLSNRPKYLRYNPNRRSVILQFENGGEKGDGFGAAESDFQNAVNEEESSSDNEVPLTPSVGEGFAKAENDQNVNCLDLKRSDSHDSGKGVSQGVVKEHVYKDEIEENGEEVDVNRKDFPDSQKCSSEGEVKKDNYEDEVEENNKEEVEEEFEEEAEQYEEVKGSSLKGIMKFLVALSILVLATSFIFPMDFTVLNSEEVTAGPKDGYSSIQEHLSQDFDKDGYGIFMGVAKQDFEDVELVEDNDEVMTYSGHEQVEIGETRVKRNDVPAIEDEWPEQFSNQLNVAANAVNGNSINGCEMETEVEWNEDVLDLEAEWMDKFAGQTSMAATAESADLSDGSDLKGIKEQSGMPECDEEPVDLGLVHEPQAQSTKLVADHDPLEKADVVVSSSTKAASEMRLPQQKNNATGPIIIGIICSLFSIISGALFFIFRSKARKDSEPHPLVSKILPTEKLVSTEAPFPVTPKVKENKTENFSQICAPTVKLLGELVVREVVTRSLQRCDRKGGELINSEESSNIQERRKSVFQVTNPPAPAPEYSNADSPSCYGSFTTEAKIIKKEKGRGAEFTTPVRRSSRIRSHSVTST